MKVFLASFLFLFTLTCIQAQDFRMAPSNGKFIGKVVDPANNKGIEAASVQLFIKGTDSLVGGMLTRPNGDFSLENLKVSDTFRLVISAIGFKEEEREVFFAVSGDRPPVKDLGNLPVTQQAESLGAVTVTAQRSALTMGIDRKVFNADQALTAAGGTAVDLMKNIPSVTVDVDGNVQLRNASPQIFVDGRPTILTLDQIPADNIERVELITNPSAKFDAASGGGIINVVLKKNKRLGLNGIASIGAGSPGILNGNLTLNLREGKFNFFASGSYNESGGKARGETYRQNKRQGIVTDYFNQQSLNERERRFGSVRFGFDFYLDNRNTFTVTQNFVKGKFGGDETQNQQYFDITQQPLRYGDRIGISNSDFNRSNTQFIYKHNFAKEGKEITADVSYNTGKNNNGSSILNNYYNIDGSIFQPANRVENFGSGNNDQLTVQIDYVNPVSEKAKWEFGVRSYMNSSASLFNAFSLQNGSQTKLPLSNNYEYEERVNAVYGTFSGAAGTFKYQLGLRAEQSKFDGLLVDSVRKFGYEYPAKFRDLFDGLFPSIFLTKDAGNGHEFQVNYSRRIRRPNFWQLNPFVDIADPVNIRQGNPALKPEFINSFEFNYNYTYNTGSFLGVLYYRNNPADITQYSDTISAEQYEKLNNAAVDPNAILNTFVNAQSTNRMGAEFTLQQKIGTSFDITPSINLQYRKVNAIINDLDLSNEGFNWEAKLIANYRIATESPASIFNKLSFQLTGEYESPEVIPQGKRKEQYNVDFALRKEFLKNNRASFTFSINDVFNTRRFGTIYDTEQFYQDSYRRWNVRSFRVTFSYKFGSSDFSLFPRRNNDRRDDDDDRNAPPPDTAPGTNR